MMTEQLTARHFLLLPSLNLLLISEYNFSCGLYLERQKLIPPWAVDKIKVVRKTLKAPTRRKFSIICNSVVESWWSFSKDRMKYCELFRRKVDFWILLNLEFFYSDCSSFDRLRVHINSCSGDRLHWRVLQSFTSWKQLPRFLYMHDRRPSRLLMWRRRNLWRRANHMPFRRCWNLRVHCSTDPRKRLWKWILASEPTSWSRTVLGVLRLHELQHHRLQMRVRIHFLAYSSALRSRKPLDMRRRWLVSIQ